ncbi:MAG: T9SS type A sorting domain-containing protein, partial [Bacteroidetes bacterium]|nr:T9SS type A sorting domain-containing protein [Bacteroidota bacterium]
DLQVKRFNGTSWERVGQIISGARTDGIDIAFDNNNVAHVSCREGENNAMMLKYNKSNGFWDLVGYSFAYRGAGTNIAFDSKNRPHALYADIDHNQIPYVKFFENDLWDVVGGNSFDTSGVYGYYGFAIDKNDNIYVALTRNYMKQIMVYKYDGTSWSVIGENITGGEAFNTRIAVDNWGKVYVLFRDGLKKNRATLMTLNGSTWESVGPRGFNRGNISFGELVVDNNNMPLVSYRDGGNNENFAVMSYGLFTDVKENRISSNEVNAYPNPAKDRVQLDMKNINEGIYLITDIFGHTIAKGSFSAENVSINVKDLSSGVYFISILSNNQQWYSKFTKE